MKQEKSLARIISRLVALSLIGFACLASARAQASGTVIPSVCVETAQLNGTTTLAADATAGATQITVTSNIPIFATLTINPGGTNQETVPFVKFNSTATNLILTTDLGNSLPNPNSGVYRLVNAHAAGETVQFNLLQVDAYWGYNNTGSLTVHLQRGSQDNFFAPGYPVKPGQISDFLPGIHERVFLITFGGQRNDTLTWFLRDGSVGSNKDTPRCATITYQGRLTNAGAQASGSYDMQFTVYDALAGGTAQSEMLTVANVQVTNGVFTAPLNFGASLFNNNNARFLEIGVRPGGGSGAFTLLAPRQPITQVPYAINAQTATNAAQLGGVAANQFVQTNDARLTDARAPTTGSTNYIQNSTTQQTANINISGNGTLGGNLTVSGAVIANSISGNGAGLTGIFSVYSLTAQQNTIAANASGYTFIGQTQTVTFTANQRLTGAGSIPLATSSGTNVVSVGLCYKIGAGAITNFAGNVSTNTIVDTTYKIYAASATVEPGAGVVQFGLCVGNNSQPLLSNSVNGWVMVTNN